jgi:hypothetical protein
MSRPAPACCALCWVQRGVRIEPMARRISSFVISLNSVDVYSAKLPLIHCGFEALANHVNVVGNGCLGNRNRPKKSASYSKEIWITASSITGFPKFSIPFRQSILSDCPFSIISVDPERVWPSPIELLIGHLSRTSLHVQCTFRILKTWLGLLIAKGKAKAHFGSDAEAINVASAS